MAVKDNTTKKANISAQARVIDFVSRFENRWDGLREMISISRPVRKEAGSMVYIKKASVILQSGSVSEGDEIPYSQASVVETPLGEIAIEKYAKGVTLEAIDKYGYDTAIEKTDDEFLAELQSKVMDKFFSFAAGGDLTGVFTSFQMAMAMAKGAVENKFRGMHKGITGVVAFVNYLDFYSYEGSATLTVQNQFGMDYIENFMGFRVVFLCADNEVAKGTIIATTVDNLIMYYIDPSDSAFARAGLDYTTAGGDTNLIGAHVNGNYGHAVSEMFAIMGITLAAEYIDAIAVITIEASGSLGSVTFSSGAATNVTGASKLTISAPATLKDDWKFFIKDAASTAPSAPSYLAQLDSTWKEIHPDLTTGIADDVTGLTSGNKATLVITNGMGQALYANGTGVTVVVKA